MTVKLKVENVTKIFGPRPKKVIPPVAGRLSNNGKAS